MNYGIAADVLSLIFNIAIVVMTAVAMSGFFFRRGGSANMKVENARCFEYFTVDSNLLVTLTAAVMIFFKARALLGGPAEIPYWATLLKLVGTTAVFLTFLVVMLILAPIAGYGYMIEGGSLYMHLITPLAAAVTFIFFDGGPALDAVSIALSLIPTFVYGIVYFVMVVIVGEKNGGWEDFYGFNKGGRWYLSVVAMLGMTAVTALLLRLAHNAFAG